MSEEKVIIEIDNVRIRRNDNLNYVVERLETSYSTRHKKEFTSYQFKGYYGTVAGALKGISYQELLIDENSVTDLKSYLEQVMESNEKILNFMEESA